MRSWLLVGLILSPLTVGCYDDSVEPSTQASTRLVTQSAALPLCREEHRGYLAFVGAGHDFRGYVQTVTSTCVCEYQEKHNAIGCRVDAFCESSYDIGADNPQSCETSYTNPEILDVTATVDSDDCTITVTKLTPESGTFTGTLTCAREGEVSVHMEEKTSAGTYQADVLFSVLTADTPCERDGG